MSKKLIVRISENLGNQLFMYAHAYALSKKIIKDFLDEFEKLSKTNKESLEKIVNDLISKHKTNFKGVGQPLRIALTGSRFGPGIYDIILSLNKDVIVKRLKK